MRLPPHIKQTGLAEKRADSVVVPASVGLPVFLRIWSSEYEVGTIRSPEELPALLRAVADEMENPSDG
jgi:hypothetical protein